MLYLNQLDHRGVPYCHNVKNGGVPPERQNVATSGCGLCSMCMIVDQLTVHSLSVPDCAARAEASGANWRVGCDMTILGPAAARRFGLEYGGTWDPGVLRAHLAAGGRAVANVTGDRPGHIGLFSHVRHYVVLLSVDGDEVTILDPGYTPEKYEEEGRRGLVRIDPPFIYCDLARLEEDCRNFKPEFAPYPPFHLFKRKA